MRRSHLTVLASVSFAALVSVATTSQAVMSPKMSFGLLKPTEQWKVGTVQSKDSSYCAMVSKFEKEVVLAFARDALGNSSVAMDFREQFFESGAEYEVTLKTEGAKTRTFTARASSGRSVVVQIGKDESFMKAMGSDKALAIGMPTIDVSFALRKFGPSYRSLVNCSGEIGADAPPAVKVKQVEEEVLTPVDREVALLSGDATAASSVASADETAEQGSFAEIETQMEQEAVAEARKSSEQIEWLDSQHAELSTQIADGKAQVAQLEATEEKAGVRKLIASIGGQAPLAPVETGKTARVLEQQQAGRVAQETLKKEVAAKEAEIAALSRSQSKMTEEALADFARQRAEMDKRAEKLTQESAALRQEKETLSADNKSLKADIVAKQAELARVEGARAAETESLTGKLAATHEEYGQKIATLQAERDILKQKLDTSLALNEKLQTENRTLADGQKQLGELQNKVSSYAQEKADLTERLSMAEKQNLVLQAAMEAKQQELAESKDAGKSLSAVSTELASLKAAHAATVERLQKQITEKSAAFETLKKDNEAYKASMASAGSALQDQKVAVAALESRKEEVAQLEERLKQVEQEKIAEADRAAKLQDALEQSRRQVAEIRTTLDSEHARLAEMQATVDARESVLAKKEETPAIDEVAVAALPAPIPAPVPAVPVEAVTASVADIEAPAASIPLAADLAAAEPSSGDVMEGPSGASSGADDIFWFDSAVETSVKEVEKAAEVSAPALAPVPYVQPIPAARQAPEPQQPAVVKTPPQVRAEAAAPKASTRRAAALLDRVMAFHRPEGSSPSAVSAISARSERKPLIAAVKTPVASVAPVRKLDVKTPVVAELAAPVVQAAELSLAPAPVAEPAFAPVPAETLPGIEAAAGNFDVRTIDGPAGKRPAPEALSLEALLDKAGLSGIRFVPVEAAPGEVVRQWSSGEINGMFEQADFAGGSFEGAIHAYIERYREDCPGQLTVNFGEERKAEAGLLAVADIGCSMPGNSYATSFVFLGNGSALTSILHTAYPASMPQLKSITDNVVYALETSGGIAAPAAGAVLQPARLVPVPSYEDEFETVVVQ